ncbi:MAG: hypothetical protein EOR86_13340 [Mesorhizobium sp.]|uniref:hypothetical protein n=1 Tax=Mesorhizobium sp. TaxID=1871066 RepID=UPI000FE565A7|nr:hypothetical protein [Mesorhizobium sp.]RWM96187.1 MAG: hypothetical protein EOR86_13340 [Mesorhizobium sp.]
MARRDQHILLRDPLADTFGQPEPDKRSKHELAEAEAAMTAELARREAGAAETDRAEAARKVALAEAAAKAEAERKLREAEKINNARPARLGGIQGWF